MQSTLRPRLVVAILASLASPACAAAGIAVFSDDFATSQTLAEHWRADGAFTDAFPDHFRHLYKIAK